MSTKPTTGETSGNLPLVLGTVFMMFWGMLAWAPVSRTVWWAENIPVILVFGFLVWHGRFFRFSSAAYLLMAFWLFWHTVGGHYTFAHVPFGWVSDLFGFQRNHFDRIGHFSVGFYAFAIAEYLRRRQRTGLKLSLLFALFSIMAVAAAYEIFEWWYAVGENGQAGIEVLGAQGDIWDAQKDMLLDTLGAIFSLGLFLWLRPDRPRAGIQPKE